MLPHFFLKLKLHMSVVQAGSGQLHAVGLHYSQEERASGTYSLKADQSMQPVHEV
jgi:hypothetical protein